MDYAQVFIIKSMGIGIVAIGGIMRYGKSRFIM